ncbi:MAG TPA: TonB-dependent receptor plug domain-containing protein [Gemmatimonadota bacterium]|nr:TonB-dependent receptor plug domain-containing protein [Gemmatimonadota bacterium]
MKAIASLDGRTPCILSLAAVFLSAPAAPLRAQLDAPLIDIRSTATGSAVDMETLENLPNGPNVADLASTIPQTGSPARTSLTASGDGLITIDGVVIGDGAALGNPGTYVDFEHVEDVQVQTGGGAAEYGNSAAGVLRIVTKEGETRWEGTGRYLVEGGDPNDVGSLTNPGIQIDVRHDANGACLSGFQVLDGGVPRQGAGDGGPIQFGFDSGFTIGVGSGSGTAFGAGADGSLNLSSIPGCPGQPFGMSFVDAPGSVTPANRTGTEPQLLGLDPQTGSLVPVEVKPVAGAGTIRIDPRTGTLSPVGAPVPGPQTAPTLVGFIRGEGTLVPVEMKPVPGAGTIRIDPRTGTLSPVGAPVPGPQTAPTLVGFIRGEGTLVPVEMKPVPGAGTIRIDPHSGTLSPVGAPVPGPQTATTLVGFIRGEGTLVPVEAKPVAGAGTIRIDPRSGTLSPVGAPGPGPQTAPPLVGFIRGEGTLVPVELKPVAGFGPLRIDPTSGLLTLVGTGRPLGEQPAAPALVGFIRGEGTLVPVELKPVAGFGPLRIDPTSGLLTLVGVGRPLGEQAGEGAVTGQGVGVLQETGTNPKPLFSESFYDYSPNITQLFPHGFFTEASLQSAPSGRGVQDIGLEIRSAESERTLAPAREADVPGGATSSDGAREAKAATGRLQALADGLDSPLLYVVANGGPTGEVFQVRIVHPASGRVAIDGLVAVEPVAATADDREDYERELADAGGIQETLTAAGYCLDQDLLAPPAGTVYRVAPAAKQSAFAPMRRALDAARRLRDAGQLDPDSDPTDYYHAIRQWAVWTIEKGYDREGFLDAFVERTEKNFRDSGQPWSADVAAAVRSYGEGRWADIREILDAAEATP